MFPIPVKKSTVMFFPSVQNHVGHIPYYAQLNFMLIETKFPIFKLLKEECVFQTIERAVGM